MLAHFANLVKQTTPPPTRQRSAAAPKDRLSYLCPIRSIRKRNNYNNNNKINTLGYKNSFLQKNKCATNADAVMCQHNHGNSNNKNANTKNAAM